MKRKLFSALMLVLLICFVFASCEYLCKNHNYEDGICTKCGKEEPIICIPPSIGNIPLINTPWKKTDLVFQISENSNCGEIASTSRRYLAGDVSQLKEDTVNIIDSWIADRNTAALEETNLSITYEYVPDDTRYCWAQNISIIIEEVNSKEPDRPDIYSNFVYDMVSASLRGAFANLKSTTMYKDGHELAGAEHNYFLFVNPDKNTPVNEFGEYLPATDDGYMYAYMESLTLSKEKMYCLASDYFTDLIRAELIVPVNISLLESLQATPEKGLYNSDRVKTYDKDGNLETNYTYEDFCCLVYNSQWTYSTLADFSAAITNNDYDDENTDLRDTVGFALGTASGLGTHAMLYSNPNTIIEKKYDPEKWDFTYYYPYMSMSTDSRGDVQFMPDDACAHDYLVEFCDKIYDLFSSDGVIMVNNHQTYDYGSYDIEAIRKRFATNNVLFGGVICLGTLEYDEYKAMNGENGTHYGIAPVPLHNCKAGAVDEDTIFYDTYNPQIHNIGKIGAISYSTEKFAQCTAYLNYMSTHSTDILNEYYDYAYQYDVSEGETKCNVEMLKYIRTNIRWCLDKTFEDALARFYASDICGGLPEEWHTIIRYENLDVSYEEMIAYYATLAPKKAWRLYDLENSVYPTLPS